VLLVAALTLSVIDWVAVAQGRRVLELICKPSAVATYLAAAIALSPSSSVSRTWFCVALVFCVFGDVFLMGPAGAFIAGLASFAIAQFCFSVGFLHQHPTEIRFFIGITISMLLAVPLAARIVRALRSSNDGALVAPVAMYIVLIFAMATSAIAAGTVFGIAGAALFLVSDSLLAESRFVVARLWEPVAVIVTYHLALAGFVLSLT
jgi:alkylglycerol monooxygenase